MHTYKNEIYDNERALYGQNDIEVVNCKFDGPADGESALKECSNIVAKECYFNLRYPLWHVKNADIYNCEMTELCRAALWYDENITIENSVMNGIKAFRECKNITLESCTIKSPEFLWRCKEINISNSTMESEYPFFECRDIAINNLNMKGKYSFQYVENMTIDNSEFDTKDAFWHSKNVTVTDSVIKGEYLGWYSENLKLVRCKITGTQPLCYCKGLVLEDCTMEETDLSFERSEVKAYINGRIESVKNPVSGIVKADEIGELIMETEYADPSKTDICCRRIQKITQ